MTRGTAEKINRAAESLLSDRSFADITTREVAERAGIAEATLFRHITTKADLFLRVYGDRMDTLLDAYERIDRERAATETQVSAGSFIERILQIYEARTKHYQGNFANAVEYLLAAFDPSSPRRPRTVAQGERIIRVVERILGEAVASGHLKDGTSVRLTAEAVHAVEMHEIVRSPLRQYPAEQMWDRLRPRIEHLLTPILVDH